MKTWMAGIFICLLFSIWSCDEKKSESSGGVAVDTDKPFPGFSTVVGQLNLPPDVSTDILPASVEVLSKPELTAKSDENGKFALENVLPGQLTILATTSTAAGLTNSSSRYGVKIDDIIVKHGEVTDLGEQAMTLTGSISGMVTFFEADSKLEILGTDVFIPGTSLIAKTDADGKFTITGLPEGTYELSIQRDGYSTITVDEIVVESDKTTEVAELVLSISKGPEGTIQTVGHQIIKIDGKDQRVFTSRDVSVKLHYDNETALMKIADEPTFLGRSWEKVQQFAEWTFDSDGLKDLYVTFSNPNGLESSPYKVSFLIDTEDPVLTSFIILNNWAQVAGAKVYGDITGTDTGTGIKEISFSEVSDDFSNGETWQVFSKKKDYEFATSTPGNRTLYVKIRDYVGNESTVISDSINLDAETVVVNQPYGDLVFKKDQSPYIIDTDFTADGNVTVEKGVRITLKNHKSFTVKGTFTAVGALDDKIVFDRLDPAYCGANFVHILLNAGLPGTSAKSKVEHVHFIGISYIDFNGGVAKNNHFDGSECNSSNGVVRKTGLDNLTLDSNIFEDWATALDVQEGNGNTIIKNSTTLGVGVDIFFVQSNTAKNTTVEDNNVTVSSKLFGVENGKINESGTVVSGSGYTYWDWSSTEPFTMSNQTLTNNASRIAQISNASSATVSNVNITNSPTQFAFSFHNTTATVTDLTVTATGSAFAVQGSGGSDVSITNSTISADEILMVMGEDTSLSIDYSDLTAGKKIVSRSGSGTLGLSFNKNNITCSNNAAHCDLMFADVSGTVTTSSINMTNNNIVCANEAGFGCRGFSWYRSQQASSPLTETVTFTNNYWTGKARDTDYIGNYIDDVFGNANSSTDTTTIRFFVFENGSGGPHIDPSGWSVTLNAESGSLIGDAGPQP